MKQDIRKIFDPKRVLFYILPKDFAGEILRTSFEGAVHRRLCLWEVPNQL
jgi:hypothetical protein